MLRPRRAVHIVRRRPRLLPSPGLFGGLWPVVLALGVLALPALRSCPAHGQPLPPRAERTASWYADHPDVLARVTELCRDDPGNLRNDPDCVNAAQARVIAAHREADRADAERRGRGVRRPGDLTPPSSPRYWRDRPEERAQKLAYCERMTPAQQAGFFCAPARTAERQANGRRP